MVSQKRLGGAEGQQAEGEINNWIICESDPGLPLGKKSKFCKCYEGMTTWQKMDFEDSPGLD